MDFELRFKTGSYAAVAMLSRWGYILDLCKKNVYSFYSFPMHDDTQKEVEETIASLRDEANWLEQFLNKDRAKKQGVNMAKDI